MEKKYAFFDIDGTLLPEGQEDIPQNTIDSIQKLKANGVKVFICTGRCYHQAKKYIDALDTDSYIVSNGQEAVVDGQEIYSYNMTKKEINILKEKLTDTNVFWGFETRDNIYLQNMDGVDGLKKTINGYGNLKVKIGDIQDDHDIKQMWAFGKKEILTILEREIIDDFKYFRWSDDSMEIISQEESKAKAMKKVVEHTEDKVKTYAFGDGFNDIELIGDADVGVAMGNAKIEIKAIADYETTAVDEDGITKALEGLGLI